MKKLSSDILDSFKLAINLLTGYEKRKYVAELTLKYFDGSPYKIESKLGVRRCMVIKGLKERETGIRCLDAYQLRGRKKKKNYMKD